MEGSVLMHTLETIDRKVTWVGKADWELEKFHGDELSTTRVLPTTPI